MKITLDNITSMSVADNGTWRRLTDEEADRAFEKMRSFFLENTTKRATIRPFVERARRSDVKSYGINSRLWYDTEKDKVTYCAGQDYVSEYNLARKIFCGIK